MRFKIKSVIFLDKQILSKKNAIKLKEVYYELC